MAVVTNPLEVIDDRPKLEVPLPGQDAVAVSSQLARRAAQVAELHPRQVSWRRDTPDLRICWDRCSNGTRRSRLPRWWRRIVRSRPEPFRDRRRPRTTFETPEQAARRRSRPSRRPRQANQRLVRTVRLPADARSRGQRRASEPGARRSSSSRRPKWSQWVLRSVPRERSNPPWDAAATGLIPLDSRNAARLRQRMRLEKRLELGQPELDGRPATAAITVASDSNGLFRVVAWLMQGVMACGEKGSGPSRRPIQSLRKMGLARPAQPALRFGDRLTFQQGRRAPGIPPRPVHATDGNCRGRGT